VHVIEYDGKSLLDYNQNRTLGMSQHQVPVSSHDYSISNSLDQQISTPSLPVHVLTGQPSMDPGATVGGIYYSSKVKIIILATQAKGFCNFSLHPSSFTSLLCFSR